MAINDQDFADPISRRLARGESLGEDSQVWLDPQGRAVLPLVNGGIVNPDRYVIADRTALYRFGSTQQGVQGLMSGGWWLERRELDQLISWSRINDRTLGFAVRLLCCVPPEWGSALNFLIGVRASGELLAWRGLANSAVGVDKLPADIPAFAKVPTVIRARNHIAALRVPQLFIPGTRRLLSGAGSAMFIFEGQWQTEGAVDWIHGSGTV